MPRFETQSLPVSRVSRGICTYDEVMVAYPTTDTRVPLAADEQRWRELLARLDPATLTEALLPRVDRVDGYQSPPIPRSEIRRTAELSMEVLLRALRTGSLDNSVTVPSEIGVSRARAGIELSSLMAALQLDFAVLWDGLLAVADDADAQLIVHRTRAVMRTVDAWVSQAQRAYLAETQRMREESASLRRDIIDAVFHSTPGSREEREAVAAVASECGYGVAEPLLVVAAVRGDIPALRVGVAELERFGVLCQLSHLDGALIVFLAAHPGGSGTHADPAAHLGDMRVGMAPAPDGITGLRAAAARARELALLLTPDESGAMTRERGWARQAARALDDAGSPVIADVEAALAQCSAAKRERLLETVRCYLASGSISDTAAALFCHRNTVSKQLQQFRDVTGVDPTIPQQAARLVVGWA